MTAITKYGPTNSSQRFVLLMIADNAADDGSNAFPSVETLAEKTALSDRTVIRAINALVKDGYLIRRRRKDTSNTYRIVLEKLGSPVSDNLSPTVSDKLSPTQVTPRHPGTCQDVTYESDTVSPDPSLLNHPFNHQGERGAIAPAPIIDPNSFQPVPESLKRQKARRGVVEATPVPPPAALALLHELTGYWPGDDNADYLIGRLGANPDRSTLARAVELWRASGHKINNWLGICDWYQEILRDPAWTPQPRFKPKQGGANSAARPTVSTPEPGSQPVTW